jgi:hypothetical protein
MRLGKPGARQSSTNWKVLRPDVSPKFNARPNRHHGSIPVKPTSIAKGRQLQDAFVDPTTKTEALISFAASSIASVSERERLHDSSGRLPTWRGSPPARKA